MLQYKKLFAEDDGEGSASGGGGSDDELSRVRTALARAKQDKNVIQQELNALRDKLNKVDLDEYVRLKQEAQEKETGKLSLAAQMESLKTAHAAQMTAVQKEAEALKSSLEALQLETAIKSAYRRNNPRTDSVDEDGMSYEDLVLLAARNRATYKDGKVVALDKYGLENPEYTLDSLMKDLSEKGATSACFAPKNNNSGGGMQETVKGGTNLGLDARTKLMSLSPEDRIAYAKENNIPLDKPLA